MTALTISDLAGKTVRLQAHLNLGSNGYGYAYRFVDYPRLGYVDYGYKGAHARKLGKTGERKWTLDGAIVESLDFALAGYATAPELDDREKAVLALVPDEFEPLREVEKRISAELGDPPPERDGYAQASATTISTLHSKGLVEIGRRKDEPNEMQKRLGLEHLAYTPLVRRKAHG
ncbi:hypothetical protein [Bosea sp. TAF32]|uniref:hypothetical protein n=1 Tax=Bosea sp. TAF32 TaxID=3237482 RepID=UPI003F9065DB